MAKISDVGMEFLKSGMRLISQTNSDHLLNDKVEKEPMPVVIEKSETMEEWHMRHDSTPREKYIFALTQLQNAAKLLGGELTETACYDHTGQASNRFISTYSVRNRDDVDPFKAGDPPGSEHSPTLQRTPGRGLQPPFDTEAYRHFKDVMDLDNDPDPYGGAFDDYTSN